MNSDQVNNNKKNNQSGLSHLDSDGDITMVDVSGKTASTREAHASGEVVFPADIYTQIKAADGMTKKGSLSLIHI